MGKSPAAKPDTPASSSDTAVAKQLPPTWLALFGKRKATITSITAKDGYLAWLERRLDARTSQFRAPIFHCAVFRADLSADQFDLLYMEQLSGYPDYILGSNGTVVVSEGKSSYLFRTGHPPESLKLDDDKNVTLVPRGIYSNCWICTARSTQGDQLVILPAKDYRPVVDQRAIIEQSYNFSTSFVSNQWHWDGIHLLYPSWQQGDPFSAALWDSRQRQTAWRSFSRAFPMGLDRQFAYASRLTVKALPQNWQSFYSLKEMCRCKLGVPEQIERAVMKEPLGRELACEPPYLIGMFQTADNPIVFRLNIESGEATHCVPLSRIPKVIAADIVSNAVYAADSNTIYRIPLAPLRRASPFLEWKSLDPDKTQSR